MMKRRKKMATTQPAKKKCGIRTSVMCSLNMSEFGIKFKDGSPVKRLTTLGSILRYAMRFGMTHKRTIKMDVPGLVKQWIEATVGMCLAHSKDEYDAHDAKADTLLGPLLTAPVAQIREFYAALLEAMHADKRVPMLVWMGFEAWGELKVKDAPDEGIKRLKNKLAQEIAELVEEDIRDQIPNAVKRALRWRDPETLEKVKEVLESGVKRVEARTKSR